MGLIQCETDDDFTTELNRAGSKLVVVDFYATWCGPCRRVAPAYELLSNKYPGTVFLKVDVDKCQDTAQTQGVRAMPTFMFYKNKVRVESIRGADINRVEDTIKNFGGADTADGNANEATGLPPGHMDLSSFLDKSQSECLNESDDNTWEGCLGSGTTSYLESDCDPEIILALAFSQPVKLHSIKIYGPKENGPKDVKLFINQPQTIDFDQARRMEPLQTLKFTAEDLSEGNIVPLKFVKLQNVQQLTLFMENNQTNSETTRVDQLIIVGSPVQQTNMADFKRVAGKKGEAH